MKQSTTKKKFAFLAAITTVILGAGLFWLISTGLGAGLGLYSTTDNGVKTLLGLVVIGVAVIYGLYRIFLLFGQEPEETTESSS
jgi:hypothetical protein